MVRYDETRRNDPHTRQLTKSFLEAQELAVSEALELIAQAYEKLSTANLPGERQSELSIYRDALDAVGHAAFQLRRAQRSEPLNETYIGNMAASPVGAVLLKLEEKGSAEA